MKILLVYPEYEDTFWNFKKVLRIIGKKSAYPPLGLLTVASMIPKDWERKLVDLNCEKLKDEHIRWADYVFISAILGQKESAKKIINAVKKFRETCCCRWFTFHDRMGRISECGCFCFRGSRRHIP